MTDNDDIEFIRECCRGFTLEELQETFADYFGKFLDMENEDDKEWLVRAIEVVNAELSTRPGNEERWDNLNMMLKEKYREALQKRVWGRTIQTLEKGDDGK